MGLNSKQSDAIRTVIIEHLAKGQFRSGEELGELLGVSRAAISNHIKCLSELGLDIYSVQGKGYRLATPLVLLNKDRILSYLDESHRNQLSVLNIIDSTNQFIKQHQHELANGHVCVAEAQTAGRGRHGRRWVSPYGASLYLSMHWTFEAGYQALGGLSLAVGVAVLRTLAAIGLESAQVKWPNDIYVQGKKLSGVLIEVEGQIGAACQCIIGIGVNVELPKNLPDIDQPFIDIASACGQSVDRNQFAAILIKQLTETLLIFERSGLEPFIQQWRAADIYADKPIKLIIGHKTINGIGRGINEQGALLIETSEGLRAYQGGEISVRPA